MKNETKPCSRLVIVIEDDMIQSIITDNPGSAPDIAIVDYDADDYADYELRHITQSDGSRLLAHVKKLYVEEASIGLDDAFPLDMDDDALSLYLMNQQIVTEDMTILELSDLTHEELVSQSAVEAGALAEKGFAVDSSRIYSILELLRDQAILTREYLGD